MTPLQLLTLVPLLVPQSSEAPPLRHLVLLEHGPKWPVEQDDALQRVLALHGEYVRGLFSDGRALLGGPGPDAAYGILVLAVDERAEVDRIVAGDPAIEAGVFVADVRPFRGVSALDLAPHSAQPVAQDGLAPVRHEVVVPAPLGDVWRAWSTAAGAEEFLAPAVEIELAPHGRLEVLWSPDAPPGQRGAEDLHVLAFVPERMLAFEWNAPPQFARARARRTFVVVELEALAAQRTRVVLLHQGFAEEARLVPELAQEWREVRAYFDGAWSHVLGALERRFTSGPVDWTAVRAADASAR